MWPPQRLSVNSDNSTFPLGYYRHSWRVHWLSVEIEIGRTKKQQSNCFRVRQVITESAKLQWLGIAKEKSKEVSSNFRDGKGESLIKQLLATDLISPSENTAGSGDSPGERVQGNPPSMELPSLRFLGLSDEMGEGGLYDGNSDLG